MIITKDCFHFFYFLIIDSCFSKITANDPDEGINGEVYYSLLSGNIDSHFLFNNLTAELKTDKELDRETIYRYVLVIQAHDSKLC